MSVTTPDPATHRRKLRAALRQSREQAQLTQHAAADKLDWSVSKLLRIESGSVGVSVTDLRALLDLYRVSDPGAIAELVESARASKGRPWWHEYRDVVKPQYGQYLGYESIATDLKIFNPTWIPGLAQTEESAMEINRVTASTWDPSRPSSGSAQLALRMERQERLYERGDVRDITMLLDEGTIRRRIGTPAAMQRQLRHLKHLAARPRVTLGVVPFSGGIHPALSGPFIVLQFAGGEDDVLYVEGQQGDLLIREDQEAIAERLAAFEEARELALVGAELDALLDQALDALSAPAAELRAADQS